MTLAELSSRYPNTAAVVCGAADPPLWNGTLGRLVEEQGQVYKDKAFAYFPWQSVQCTFSQLASRSRLVANALLCQGLRHGDRVGILAGNCYEFLEIFIGAARIGCPLVLLQPGFSPKELETATIKSGMSL